jgi:hypothetical protein
VRVRANSDSRKAERLSLILKEPERACQCELGTARFPLRVSACSLVEHEHCQWQP